MSAQVVSRTLAFSLFIITALPALGGQPYSGSYGRVPCCRVHVSCPAPVCCQPKCCPPVCPPVCACEPACPRRCIVQQPNCCRTSACGLGIWHRLFRRDCDCGGVSKSGSKGIPIGTVDSGTIISIEDHGAERVIVPPAAPPIDDRYEPLMPRDDELEEIPPAPAEARPGLRG